jgi:RHS repeat-associated protein
VTQVTDPKNQLYKYRYNALGWLIRQEDPAAKRDTMEYTVDGDLRRRTDRRNLSLDFSYDSLHRVVSRVGTSTMTYSYPSHGRQVVGASPVATDTIFLNVRGQPDSAVTRMAGQRYGRIYKYTSGGLQDTLRIIGGASLTTRGYGWDTNRGLLTAIKLGTAQTSITRDAALQDSARAFPGSAGSILRTFGSLRAPVKITSTAAPETSERWIGFDAAGRISEHLVYGGMNGRFFVYDSLGRYRSAADSSATGTMPPGCPDGIFGSLLCNDGLTWSYVAGTATADTFDVVGNRTSKGGTYTTGTNRITGFNGCSYVTDAAGSDSVRTCGGTVTTFTWNKEGQLTGLAVTGQASQTFDYDAFGRLVKKTAGGTASYFLWDGQNLLAELTSNGTTVTAEYSYYPGLDRPHALIVGGSRYYHHADGLGNVIALIDESGSVQRTFTYDDWGQLTASTDPGSFGNKDRARWKGALWMGPETELYYMRNRWHEPRTGRFISDDPIGIAGGINPYVFGGNDPSNASDGLGLGDCPAGFAPALQEDGSVKCMRIQRLPDIESSGTRSPFRFTHTGGPDFGTRFIPSSGHTPWGFPQLGGGGSAHSRGLTSGPQGSAKDPAAWDSGQCWNLAGQVLLDTVIDGGLLGWGALVRTASRMGPAAHDAYVAAKGFGALFAGGATAESFHTFVSSDEFLNAMRGAPIPFAGTVFGGLQLFRHCM